MNSAISKIRPVKRALEAAGIAADVAETMTRAYTSLMSTVNTSVDDLTPVCR